jgi:hypothetical protein
MWRWVSGYSLHHSLRLARPFLKSKASSLILHINKALCFPFLSFNKKQQHNPIYHINRLRHSTCWSSIRELWLRWVCFLLITISTILLPITSSPLFKLSTNFHHLHVPHTYEAPLSHLSHIRCPQHIVLVFLYTTCNWISLSVSFHPHIELDPSSNALR